MGEHIFLSEVWLHLDKVSTNALLQTAHYMYSIIQQNRRHLSVATVGLKAPEWAEDALVGEDFRQVKLSDYKGTFDFQDKQGR